MRIAERLRQIVDVMPKGSAVSLPVAMVEEWLSSEEVLEDELDLEEFAAVLRISVSTARDYCARGLVPGAYKRRGRKWMIPHASVSAFRDRQQEVHGNRNGPRSRVLGRSRRPDTSAWRNL